MSTLQNVIFVLDSRQRDAGGSIQNATYNMIAAGGVPPGTYEMLSFHSQNQFYNVELGINDLIVWDETGSPNQSAIITPGHYDFTSLGTEIGSVMSAASGDGNTYTATYNSVTGKFTIDNGGGSTFKFDWFSQSASPNLANELMGFSLIDGSLDPEQVSDRQVCLTLHSNLVIDISEDSQQNVTLLDGSEHSLLVPLNQNYQEEIDSLKQQVYSQQVVFGSTLNSLNIQLFTEDGSVVVNKTEYDLTIRKIF